MLQRKLAHRMPFFALFLVLGAAAATGPYSAVTRAQVALT